MVRGVIVRCGAPGCQTSTPLPVNHMQTTSGFDAEREFQIIARKLQHKGWRIGKSAHAHRCPKCFNAARFSTIRKAAEMNNPNAMTDKLKVVAEDNSRAMSREERRLIFSKLNEVYIDEKVGYGDEWTDEKVAKDLGVARAWVRTVRSENFGDEQGNDTIKLKVKEANEALALIRAWEPRVAELQKLLALGDKIEKSLAEISKVLK